MIPISTFNAQGSDGSEIGLIGEIIIDTRARRRVVGIVERSVTFSIRSDIDLESIGILPLETFDLEMKRTDQHSKSHLLGDRRHHSSPSSRRRFTQSTQKTRASPSRPRQITMRSIVRNC